MTPWLEDADVTLYRGDVLAVLPELPAESVDCVVTSPPYWGLRDYGQEGQLGLEPTPEQYVEKMVEVFREVRRVLAAHGTVWLNLGDSYVSGQGGRQSANGELPSTSRKARPDPKPRPDLPNSPAGWAERAVAPRWFPSADTGWKPKDLTGIPWMVAFALRADGWYLRSDIIWSKPNPMPESVTDRPTKAHEYVFLLSKQARYFFDQEAVREQFEARPQQRLTSLKDQPLASAREAAGVAQGNPQGGAHVNRFAVQRETLVSDCGCHEAGCGRSFHADDCGCACHAGEQRGPDGRRKTHVEAANGSIQHRDGERWPNGGRNIRSVWEIATQPYPEAHFATFPEELARRCIAAGCPEQVCRVCGKARERVVERIGAVKNEDFYREKASVVQQGGMTSTTLNGTPASSVTLGFTDCGCCDCKVSTLSGEYDYPNAVHEQTCGASRYRPGIVLDPFMGSGTVAHVARKLGRHAVGIDLSAEYLELAARRLQQQSLFAGTA